MSCRHPETREVFSEPLAGSDPPKGFVHTICTRCGWKVNVEVYAWLTWEQGVKAGVFVEEEDHQPEEAEARAEADPGGAPATPGDRRPILQGEPREASEVTRNAKARIAQAIVRAAMRRKRR